MSERINKYIASTGLCSRREAEKYILAKRVKVNKKIISDLATIVNDSDIVTVDDKEIKIEKKKVYIMLNKPEGYVTTAKEQFGRPSILDLVDVKERVYPVGRLDMYSEGLLLLTNDGDFTNKITHPTKHINKVYEVKLKEDITAAAIAKLKKGIDIDGYVTKGAGVVQKTKNVLEITISEGKNRQIRRMCEVIGYNVMKLKRIKIGKLELGSLETGKYIILKKSDIEKIFK